MILLNTNVVSEPLRPQPDNRVAEWLDKQLVATRNSLHSWRQV